MALLPTLDTEENRLAALERYRAMETASEQVYDDLVLLAAKAMDCPWAAMSFVGRDTVFYRSAYGANFLPERRDQSFCAHVVESSTSPFIVEDTLSEERYARLPIVQGMPFVRSYVGAPLVTADGQSIGTLCVLDDKPRSFSADEIERLNTLARLAVSQLELRRQTRLLSAANDKLRQLASCDGLTGLHNHRAFQERLEDEMLYAVRNKTALSLILIDIDYFKEYNDRFGHPAGDVVLQAVGIMLLECSREYDFVARYGGEEFAVILRGAASAEAYAVAERLREHVAGGNWPSRKVTVSVGVATFTPQLKSREALVSEADRLLYVAKESGKNCVRGNSDDGVLDPAQWVGLIEQSRQQTSVHVGSPQAFPL